MRKKSSVYSNQYKHADDASLDLRLHASLDVLKRRLEDVREHSTPDSGYLLLPEQRRRMLEQWRVLVGSIWSSRQQSLDRVVV
jgi:hypothetical protein